MSRDGDSGSDDTLAAPASDAGASASASAHAGDYGDLIVVEREHYEVGDELARGGMGRILRARDRRLGRPIAIKELLVRDPDLAHRFEREARITAQLQHPSIVNVHEAGRWPSGEPFYAMKLVAGRPLDAVVAAAATPTARLALLPHVIAVVDALAYAHSERVIHRDLKPGNVLVGDFGETVVIDWGLAKDLASSEPAPSAAPYRTSGSADETAAGAVLGTPAYMPPEQARGETVSARADVYALGALLYHVLAGAPPYAGTSADDVLAQVLAGPPRPLTARAPGAPADLAAIVARAMAREPADRFPSAREMADELKRFQTGQLVTSHRYRTRELVARWIRKHRGAVAVGAIAIALLAAIGGYSVKRVLDEKARADDEAAVARAERATALERADALTLAQAQAALDTDPTASLAWLAQLGDGADAIAARRIAADAASRGVAHVLAASGRVHGLALSPSGGELAAGVDRSVRVWDLATWTSRDRAIDRAVLDVAYAADGALIAVDAGGGVTRDGAIVRAPGATVFDAARIAPGARWIELTPHGGHHARLWDLTGATADRELTVDAAVWSSQGGRLLALDDDDAAGAIDPATGAWTELAKVGRAASIGGDDRSAAVGTFDGTLSPLARMSALGPIDHHIQHAGAITFVAVEPDGAVITASNDSERLLGVEVLERRFEAGDYVIQVWRGGRLTTFRGHRGDVDAIAYGGAQLASAGADGAIRVWRFPDERVRTIFDLGETSAMRVDHWMVSGETGPSLKLADLGGAPMRSIDAPSDKYTVEKRDGRMTIVINDPYTVPTAMVSGAHRVATLDSQHAAEVWDLDAATVATLTDDADVIAIAPDGKTIATASKAGAIARWDAATHARTDVAPAAAAAMVTALAIAADGTIAAARADGGVHVYAANGGEHTLAGPRDPLHAIAFAGGALVGGGDAGLLRVWDLGSGALRSWKGHDGAIARLAVSPDGAAVASAGADKTVRVWRLADGAVTVLRGHRGAVASIEFRGDGKALVTAGDDHTARVWDLASGDGRVLGAHDAMVLAAGFTDRDRRVVALDADGVLVDDPDDLPVDLPSLRAWIARATGPRASGLGPRP